MFDSVPITTITAFADLQLTLTAPRGVLEGRADLR